MLQIYFQFNQIENQEKKFRFKVKDYFKNKQKKLKYKQNKKLQFQMKKR